VSDNPTRREWLVQTTALATTLATAPAHAAPPKDSFRYCLNTSTLGWKLDLVQTVEITARAGYNALEPWIRELDDYIKKGGDLKVLAQRLRDRGLTVESAIDFPEWVVDDSGRRKKALEQMKRSMDLVRQLGGTRIAAPPAGATNQADLDLRRVAERYRALLELGDRMDVVPQLEIWGFSRVLRRLSEGVYAAMESHHPKACVLPDVYHLYKGGSDFDNLALLSASAFHVLHFNDYPATPPRESIADAQRIYPGNGVAPLGEIVRTLHRNGFRGVLSLELFNRDYWKQDPQTVARTGLEKMRSAVAAGLAQPKSR
jgi:sugar phosphate isomerase/epimerase